MNTTISREHIISKLAALPIFAELAPDALDSLASMVQYRRYPKGAVVLKHGDTARCMYLLISGRVKISIISPDGKELALSHLEAPAHFGEMSLIDAQPRTSDVTALSDVEVLALHASDLTSAIQLEPRLALSLIATLSSRLQTTIARLEDMAFNDATHRVMRVVLNVATAGLETRGAPIIQGMTHYDIATLAGTSRETASRVISSLAKDGVVTTKGRRIIVDVEQLTSRLERS